MRLIPRDITVQPIIPQIVVIGHNLMILQALRGIWEQKTTVNLSLHQVLDIACSQIPIQGVIHIKMKKVA